MRLQQDERANMRVCIVILKITPLLNRLSDPFAMRQQNLQDHQQFINI